MEMIKVARILNTHGIRGELKLDCSGNEDFDRDISYYIEGFEQEFKVERSRIHKGFYIVKFKGFDNINDVEKFKNKDVLISEEDLLELEEDEYYIKDLIGLKVINQDDIEIGTIKEVLDYDANDVYVIATDEGEEYIPAVAEFILDINIDQGLIKVKILEGIEWELMF